MVYYGYDPERDSPPISKAPAIAAGATVEYEFSGVSTTVEPGAKYAPFNTLFVQNASSQTVTVTLDSLKTYRIISGKDIVLDDQDVPAFYRLSITNNGAANIAAGEVNIKMQRVGITTRVATQKIQRSWLGKILGL
jgi:hypothetical protein